MATVHLPRSLVTLFTDPPPRHLQLPSTSLSGLVEAGPRLREHINVFVDGERQRELTTPLGDASVVHVIPAVAGG
ncbi:MAG TPA: MoaD/ThiS family protein [Candidatus Limnocylindria bacterium]|nr:MoaD/ThiS family protein [Candidatus Limnocylindria bacterium]